MSTDKILELGKKLKELATRGVGGEKVNAEILLEKLLKKYSLNLEDLESEAVCSYEREIPRKYEALYHQVVYSVLGDKYNIYVLGRTTTLGIECTMIQWVEIQAKYDHYRNSFDEQYLLFYSAFIKSNRIYPEGKSKKVDELTPKELEELRKVEKLSKSLEPSPFHKQIKQ